MVNLEQQCSFHTMGKTKKSLKHFLRYNDSPLLARFLSCILLVFLGCAFALFNKFVITNQKGTLTDKPKISAGFKTFKPKYKQGFPTILEIKGKAQKLPSQFWQADHDCHDHKRMAPSEKSEGEENTPFRNIIMENKKNVITSPSNWNTLEGLCGSSITLTIPANIQPRLHMSNE